MAFNRRLYARRWMREYRRKNREAYNAYRRDNMRERMRRKRAEQRAIRDAEIARSLAEWTAPDVRLTDTPMPYAPKNQRIADRDRRLAAGTASPANREAKIAELEARLARMMSG